MSEMEKWYLTTTYEEAKSIIQENLVSMKQSFIAVGYFLKHIRDNEMYKADGYASIWEFAQDNYGIGMSAASRWMKMNDKFSQNGNSPVLDEQYRGFEKSQLQEMLYLDDKQLKEVKPDMTVKEIREVRKPEVQVPKLRKPDEQTEEYLNKAARHLLISEWKWFLEDQMNRVQLVNQSPGELKKHLGKNNRVWWFSTEKGVSHINLFDDYVQLWDEKGEHIGDFGWFYFAAALQRMWNVVSLEQVQNEREAGNNQVENDGEAVATSQQENPEPVVDMNPPEEVSEPEVEVIAEENVEVVDTAEEETVEALYEETSERSDMDILRDELNKANGNLKLMSKCYSEKDIRMRKQKLIVGALAGMICELENENVCEQEQPDFPVLRNNDQRKEWLREYKDWGLWYEDEHIGARFYKYDFENGARLIAEEYTSQATEWCGTHTTAYMHLIGGPEPPKDKSGCVPRWNRNKIYNRYPNSETELVEFLKYVQKEER